MEVELLNEEIDKFVEFKYAWIVLLIASPLFYLLLWLTKDDVKRKNTQSRGSK